MSNPLDDRRHALEDEFFHRQDQKKLETLRDNLAKLSSKQELAEASGMKDDAVLDRLLELGLSAQTLAALSLVPLIEVAWADDKVQSNERDAILQAAGGKKIEPGSPAHELLQTWLLVKPPASLFQAWTSYVATLRQELTAEQSKILRNQVVGFARMVAESAGGLLGFGKVSDAEEQVLARVDAAFQ